MPGVADRRIFEWYTNYIPTSQQIDKEQNTRGYCSAGYGGPHDIKTVPVFTHGDIPASFRTTWYCWGVAINALT